MTAPTIFATDTPRARRSDPLESHRAGDRSQHNLKMSGQAVLWLVHRWGELGGSDINEFYRRFEMTPEVKYDSPRKRAGELAAEGFLAVVNADNLTRGTERIFTITEQGKREIGVAQ